jgi:hypothetical protein
MVKDLLRSVFQFSRRLRSRTTEHPSIGTLKWMECHLGRRLVMGGIVIVTATCTLYEAITLSSILANC